MHILGSVPCVTCRGATPCLNDSLRVCEPLSKCDSRSARLQCTLACSASHVRHVRSSPGCRPYRSHQALRNNKTIRYFLQLAYGARASSKCKAVSALVQNGWPLWAALSACAAGGQVLEQRTSFGAALSAPLLSLLLALLLSAAGILPTNNPAYDMVWTYVMPLGAALYLLESDLRQ